MTTRVAAPAPQMQYEELRQDDDDVDTGMARQVFRESMTALEKKREDLAAMRLKISAEIARSTPPAADDDPDDDS